MKLPTQVAGLSWKEQFAVCETNLVAMIVTQAGIYWQAACERCVFASIQAPGGLLPSPNRRHQIAEAYLMNRALAEGLAFSKTGGERPQP